MKVFLCPLFILMLVPAVAQNSSERVDKTTDSVLNRLPGIELRKSELVSLKAPFYHSVGGKTVNERTNISMRYDDQFLEIQFECLNDPWVTQNFYTVDNSPIFTQEVFEVLICNGSQPQENYLEIEINPNNALFLAKINFRYKTDGAYSAEYIETSISGVLHQVVKDAQNQQWSGYIKLPLELLRYPLQANQDTFRLNIFRIISKEDHTNTPKWKCNPKNAVFACWNSTLGTKPQFHVPERFGYLILK
jgi:hypothetical protein